MCLYVSSERLPKFRPSRFTERTFIFEYNFLLHLTYSKYILITGNDKIYQLTSQKRYELRVDMRDDLGVSRYAVYDHFRVADEHDQYRLLVGSYKGNAGNLFYCRRT